MQRAMVGLTNLHVLAIISALLTITPRASAWNVAVYVERHRPCNIFWLGEDVRFEAKIKSRIAGEGKIAIEATDYFGRAVVQKDVTLSFQPNKLLPLPVELGKLGNSYYEVAIRTQVARGKGETVKGEHSFCFGVAPKIERTAKEVREGGYRFGLKMSYLGKAWWHRDAQWDEREVLDATVNLGLQWTRVLMQQTAHLATAELLTSYPMNAILKVERFPKELYDGQRYGPLAEWEKKNGKGAWTLKTLPRKDAYQKWLREELKKIPPEQNVFEIWNEAWDKMSPEDLATLCQWISEAILKERPDAVIGPNLKGSISAYEYDARVIRAGGMKGMKMVALHPYAGSENRDWLRKYRRWLREQLGRDIEIYVTEYGSHSTPEGPAKRSEREQARRVVRQSLALYAEGVRAFTPHLMGQREETRTYHEHWFGFYRLSHQPKPVLLADANCARMVDGSRYVGDLWYGPGIGAMLFERDGTHTLALWTREGAKKVELAPGVGEVTLVNMVGAEQKQLVKDGKLPLTVGVDVIYVVGLSPALAKQATKELNPDRWPRPEKPKRNTRVAHELRPPPKLDGKLEEWKQMTQLALLNPKVNGDDASGVGYVAWDEKCLYLAVAMRDNQVMNTQTRGKLYRHDSLELFISTEPREDNPGYGPHDHQFFITPTSGEGKPIVGEVVDREAGTVVDVEEALHFIGQTKQGWVAEVAIPWRALPDFSAKAGAKAALEIRVNDADTSHARWKIDPIDGSVRPHDPTAWSLLTLRRPGPKIEIEIPQPVPCNIFAVGQLVQFTAVVKGKATGAGQAEANVSDYFGETALARTVPVEVQAGKPTTLPLDLGALAPGYYELSVSVQVESGGGLTSHASKAISFGVARFSDRTAAQAREGGYRFGLKLWLVGDIWWNRRLKWRPDEVSATCAKLGLQWTRALFTQKSYLATQDLMTKYPMNVVSKVECFPAECYDEQRYGPLADFKKTHRTSAWNKCTLPKEEPYKAWLREQVEKIPPEQNVFELWNEAWQWHKTMPAEDFAKLCQWSLAAIKEVRPEAIVGPNIHGGITSYDKAFVKAGGLRGMDLVAMHPYTAGTPENKGFRQRIRNYRDYLKRELGRDLDLYSTEYGWSTAPQGYRCVSERQQAQRIVRESLMLYAEGVKTLIPHTMGQREYDPKDREHWFGLFRLTHEPKPALLAHANCARVIDGSRFVGDLWYGPGVGAMLFERGGAHTLALWTEDEDRELTIDAKAPTVTAADLVGREQTLQAQDGQLSLKLSGDVLFLVGVGEELAREAAKPSEPLNPDRWKERAGEHTMPKLAQAPAIDGELTEWQGVTPSVIDNKKLDDIAAEWRLGWDEKNVYLAVKVKDKKIINGNPPERVHMADAAVFSICPRPERQVSRPDLYDYQMVVAPTCATGKPVCVVRNIAMPAPMILADGDRSGIRWAVATADRSWTVEAAIPFSFLPGAVPEVGRKMAFMVVVFDRD